MMKDHQRLLQQRMKVDMDTISKMMGGGNR